MDTDILALEAFERLLDATTEEDRNSLVGLRVDYHGETLVYTAHGLEKTFTCVICGEEPHVAYIGRGAPGWCYVFDKDGHYLTDLRNSNWYCKKHAAEVPDARK